MARFRIVRDGKSSGWELRKNGRPISDHRKKSAARRKAEKLASDGDSIQAQRVDGTWGPERTYRTQGIYGDY